MFHDSAYRSAFFSLALSLVLTACAAPPAPQAEQGDAPPPGAPAATPTGEVIATWGDGQLGAVALREEFLGLPARTRLGMGPEARARFVENLILQEMMVEEGLTRGFADDPAILQQLRETRRRLIVQRMLADVRDVPAPGDDEVRAFYEENLRRYSTATVRARHILKKDRAAAEDLHAELVSDPARFEELAKENSEDKASSRKGGDLGFFGHGRMAPAFEQAAFALVEPGEITEVVETPYGFHIIQLIEKRPGQQRELAQVAESIRGQLKRRAVARAVSQYRENLQTSAAIEIDRAALERLAESLPPPEPGPHVRTGH